MRAVGTGRVGLAAALRDARTVTWRDLIHYKRQPQLLVFTFIQPVIFVLLFRYVFGGAIRVPGGQYVNYLIPGIVIQTTAFGSAATAVGLAEDLSKGIVDRFRSLPMARSAVLVGRTASDALRACMTVLIMFVVGFAVGFRPHAGLLPIAAFGLAVLFGFAMSWIAATIGMAVKDPETAQTAGFIWLFPLTFASSAFVPVASMPGWLQAFAKVNPISIIVDATRAMTQGGRTAVPLLEALAWILAILAVFVPLAVSRYRHTD